MLFRRMRGVAADACNFACEELWAPRYLPARVLPALPCFPVCMCCIQHMVLHPSLVERLGAHKPIHEHTPDTRSARHVARAQRRPRWPGCSRVRGAAVSSTAPAHAKRRTGRTTRLSVESRELVSPSSLCAFTLTEPKEQMHAPQRRFAYDSVKASCVPP